VKIDFYVSDKKQLSRSGDILCTHFGFSGPLILNVAQEISDLFHQGIVTARIDLFPRKDISVLDQEIVTMFENNKNKLFKNVLYDIAPAGTAPAILSLCDSSLHEKRVHSITKEERKILVHMLKGMTTTVEGLMGYDRAIIADGGVPLQEIDMRTMQSKKCQGLFITGDLLHINRPSGGYSLQLCWTTGYVAGIHV
jgi:predicted Rossmann fold flavoprotein